MGLSLLETVAALPEDERTALLEGLSPQELSVLHGWRGQARPEQMPPPGDWSYWALVAGRGSGKSRSAAEWVCDRIEGIGVDGRPTKFRAKSIAFIGRTAGDVRRVMVEGQESGFIACAERRGLTIKFNPSRAQLTVVCPDGHEARIVMFSADEPDSLRGPQHDTVWGDEIAAWQRKTDAVGNTALTNAQAGLRLGEHPQGVFSTTPRPTPAMKAILKDETGSWVSTRMTTWDNAANLAPGFIEVLQAQYGGTTMAQQEFEGMLIEAIEGALWTPERLNATRVIPGAIRWPGAPAQRMPVMPHRAVAVDPSITFKGEGDECGIVTGGVGTDLRFYVTGDYSMSAGPDEWAREVVRAYHQTSAALVIAEGNQGYALVSSVIRNVDASVPVEIVHASDGKRARAEPVSQWWDPGQQRASIVGQWPLLEEQLTQWSNLESESPDRLDAMVWLGHWAKDRMFALPSSFRLKSTRRVPDALSN